VLLGIRVRLTSDAHVAALAIELGAPVCSTDHDYARFGGVEHVDPLS
jgi:predicted nucleic acid-binding protein